MPLAQETDGLSCATTLVPVARIGVPLLLKTILPRPAVATGALTGRIFFSIAAQKAARNEHRGTCRLAQITRSVKCKRKPPFHLEHTHINSVHFHTMVGLND
jgi:hypothetical protein